MSRIEEYLVTDPDAADWIDATSPDIEDYLDIKDGVASNEEIVVGSLEKARRLAERNRERLLDLMGRRVDPDHTAARHIWANLRYRKDLDKCTLTVPTTRMKMKVAFVIPLTDTAMDIINGLTTHRHQTGGSPIMANAVPTGI